MSFIVFSHGLDNKPAHDHLWNLWKRKLAHQDGFDLDSEGVRSTLNYWADVLYAAPDTNLADYEAVEGPDAPAGAPDLRAMPHKDDPRLRRLARTLDVDPDAVETNQPTDAEIAAARTERVPVPAWLRKRIMARFVRDAHHYFFNLEVSPRPGERFLVRDELRARFIRALQDGADHRPLVVAAHSMGTIIAYDCLKHEPGCPAIDGLMTIGSPLGIDEVQDFFPGWTRTDGFPTDTLRGPWVNVYDPLDAVAGPDPRLANDYRQRGAPVVEDLREDNWGTWRHSISKYLQGPLLRRRLARLVGA